MLLHNDPYRLFEDLFFQDQPLTPFVKKDDSYEASLEVPGFSKENLKIEIEDGYLKLKGEAEVGGKKKDCQQNLRTAAEIGHEESVRYIKKRNTRVIPAKKRQLKKIVY